MTRKYYLEKKNVCSHVTETLQSNEIIKLYIINRKWKNLIIFFIHIYKTGDAL